MPHFRYLRHLRTIVVFCSLVELKLNVQMDVAADIPLTQHGKMNE